jgi:hypothetical protein
MRKAVSILVALYCAAFPKLAQGGEYMMNVIGLPEAAATLAGWPRLVTYLWTGLCALSLLQGVLVVFNWIEG